MKISPLGKVPAITYQGQPVIESMTICEFINELTPDNKLMPEDPLLRAKARNLIESINYKFIPLFYRMMVRRRCASSFATLRRCTRRCSTLSRA